MARTYSPMNATGRNEVHYEDTGSATKPVDRVSNAVDSSVRNSGNSEAVGSSVSGRSSEDILAAARAKLAAMKARRDRKNEV